MENVKRVENHSVRELAKLITECNQKGNRVLAAHYRQRLNEASVEAHKRAKRNIQAFESDSE
jgi:L-amino acid N-acyltransferase YncA